MDIPTLSSAGIELYRTCNASCDHCSRWSQIVRKGKKEDVDSAVLKQAIQDLKQLGARSFYFSGAEPTLYPEIDMLIRQAAAGNNGKRVPVSLVTNGWWGSEEAGEERLRNYVDIGTTHLALSVDGFEETHDRIRKMRGLYQRVMRIISIATAHRFPTVKVNVTAQKENVEELPALIQHLWKQMSAERSEQGPLLPGFSLYLAYTTRYGRGWNNELSEEERQKVDATRSLLSIPPGKPYTTDLEAYKKKPFCGRCEYFNEGFTSVYISDDGTVFLCPEQFPPFSIGLGNLKKGDIRSILAQRGESDFFKFFVNPGSEIQRIKFLEEVESDRYSGMRWPNKHVPCAILNTYIYFRREGLDSAEANEKTERVIKGMRP